jgi:hypothetical protein
MKITAPGGDTLRVHRRWLPWRSRVRDLDAVDASPPWDFPDVDGDLPVVAVVLLGIALVVLLPVILLGLVFLGEALVLLLLLPAFVLARVAFGQPWIVEEVQAGTVVHAEPVRGWRAAGDRVRELAAELQARSGERGRPGVSSAS